MKSLFNCYRLFRLLFSWIASLITTLSKEKVNLLQACFPSLKEDYRLLMLFMPHVLLHSLIEGNDTDQENAYVEITAILNSFCTKKKLDSKILEVRIFVILAVRFSSVLLYGLFILVDKTTEKY